MQTNISKTQILDSQLISFAQFDNLIDNLKSDHSDVADFQLILLHGWASNKELWANLIKDLLKNNSQNQNESEKNEIQSRLKIKIFALDLPGFGGSERPENNWFVSDYADLVGKFIEKNCQKNIPIVIVGHSFGGRIAIKLASEKLENQKLQNSQNLSLAKNLNSIQNSNEKNPENTQNKLSKNQNLTNFPQELSQKNYQITKLILIGSAGFVNNSADLQLKKEIAKILKPIFSLQVMQNLKKQIYQKILKNDDYLQTSIKQTFVNTIEEDLTDFMKEIKIPTLLIFGDKDTETPPTFGHRMKELIPNSVLQIISGDHFAFVDKSKEIAVLIADFLV